MLKNHDQKKREKIAHVSNISRRREEKIMQKRVFDFAIYVKQVCFIFYPTMNSTYSHH
jgi:hypothetical protein